MTKEEIGKELDRILSAGVLGKEHIDALHKLLEVPKKPATKTKEVIADTEEARTIAVLKTTIATLTGQINPKQAIEATGQDHEKLLDDLYDRQQARQKEIIQNGFDIQIGSSDKSIKCLKTEDNAVYFLAGTAVAASMHVMQNNCLLGIITSVTQQSGRIKATLFTPSHSSQVYQKSPTASGANNLKASGTVTPCQHTGDTLTFYSKHFASGTILKMSESFYEVVGSYSEGNLVTHKVKLYEEPEKQSPTVNRNAPDTSGIPKNFSLYHNVKL